VSHWLVLPLLIPFAAGVGLLLAGRMPLAGQRWVGTIATAASLLVAIRLFGLAAEGQIGVYLIGDWPAPFGIVLVLDRLAALMLLTTALLAAGALAYAVSGTDRAGRAFHALFQFQLLGLNGAFLTGDLFNLFVFFEILLIASYSLLLHGGGPARTRSALHYVVLNLVGSSLFLIGVGLIYSATGTLNIADLAQALAGLDPEAQPIAAAGGMLLVVVFGLKAAVLPLHFWLPHAYSSATAPVAALFAIMTKVGIYAMVRVFGLMFGHGEGMLAELFAPWLLGAAILTLAGGTFGAVASSDLREMVAYLVIVSVGTLLAGLALGTTEALSGTLYYLVHSTLVGGAMFLVADLIGRGRSQGPAIVVGGRPPGAGLLAVLFLIGGVAAVGMPPLSGLVGKVMILLAAQGSEWVAWIWAAILISSLFLLIGLSRAGVTLLWCGDVNPGDAPATAALIAPAALLLAMSPLMVAFGGWLTAYTEATAAQITDGRGYVEAVLGQPPASPLRPTSVP
jgi:multicomponent K+:H+ antiporter subunit D